MDVIVQYTIPSGTQMLTFCTVCDNIILNCVQTDDRPAVVNDCESLPTTIQSMPSSFYSELADLQCAVVTNTDRVVLCGDFNCPERRTHRGGFRHVQHVRPNRGPTKRGPHGPEIVGRQHDIF